MADNQPRSLYWLFYPLAVLLILAPNMEFAVSVYPWRFSEVSWRFGAFGIGTNVSVFPLIGLVLAAVAAGIQGHRGILWTVVGVATVMTVLVLGGLAMFVLDGIQLRGTVNPGGADAFDAAAAKAVITCVVSMSVLISIAVGGARFLRRPRSSASARAPVGIMGATAK